MLLREFDKIEEAPLRQESSAGHRVDLVRLAGVGIWRHQPRRHQRMPQPPCRRNAAGQTGQGGPFDHRGDLLLAGHSQQPGGVLVVDRLVCRHQDLATLPGADNPVCSDMRPIGLALLEAV